MPSKQESRQRFAELRKLICAWDPIGVMTDPKWPRDEYDCIIGPILRLLEAGASEAQMVDYLRNETSDHFGLNADAYDFAVVARRVQAWFNRGWKEIPESITIYVALLDEGTDVWRPVTARPLRPGLYRIVGVEPLPENEHWEFPAGAIVRCEERQFSGGETGFVAVTRVEDAV